MRKLVTAAFLSLDGIMQAPGGPEEDPSGGFRYGGWITPYSDAGFGRGTAENFGRPFDLLLGRKTYDIFAGYWPYFDVDPSSSTFAAGGGGDREHLQPGHEVRRLPLPVGVRLAEQSVARERWPWCRSCWHSWRVRSNRIRQPAAHRVTAVNFSDRAWLRSTSRFAENTCGSDLNLKGT